MASSRTCAPSATRGNWRRSGGWPTSGSPGRSSGCSCLVRRCAPAGGSLPTTRRPGSSTSSRPTRCTRRGPPPDTVHGARTEPAPASTGYSSAQARVAATGLSTGGLRGGAGNRQVISVDVGDRVSHDAFGLGTVIEVNGAGDKAQATVDFGSGGTKRLVLRYAPLVKL